LYVLVVIEHHSRRLNKIDSAKCGPAEIIADLR